ncbi:hypothetical protein DOY81_009625, partial [Sarcophaga bullata]
AARMHFWIDKRSPQCGFGRSRVAASLHTGGSGLSFGHPPRRSLGHKSSSSSSANTAHVAANQTGVQPPQPPPQMNIVTATTTTPLQTLQQQQTTTNTNTDTTAAAFNVSNYRKSLQQQQQQQQSLDASLNTLNEHGIHHQQQLQHPHQSPNQTANLSAELYQTSPRIVTTFNRPLTTTTTLTPGICDHSSNLSVNQRTTYTNSTLTTMTTNNGQHHLHHQQQQQHTRHVRRTNRSIESTDLQFLPLHLKCGIFASLVLAIAFIVGIKVYFDNHGTKFEVGLFWLLTATFVFAFCFVSICKVPRVLFASASTSRSNSRDQTRDRCSMDEVAAANEANARGSMV